MRTFNPRGVAPEMEGHFRSWVPPQSFQALAKAGETEQAIQVILADDQPLVQIGVEEVLLEAEMNVVSVSSAAQLNGALTAGVPHVLVLELSFSGGCGLELIGQLRRTYPTMGVLVLTAQKEEQVGVQAILAGARGFLSKSASPDQLVRAVRMVSRGERYVSHALGQTLAEYVVRDKDRKRPHELLSAREFAVLLKISEGYTTVGIALQLELSSKTVGTYRARLLEKMGIKTTAELTRYVIENRLGPR